MLSPYRNQTPPYSLPSNIVYFHDWRYVQHGYVDWRAEDGSRPPLWTTDYLPQLHYEPAFLPVGVHLQAQPARKSGPVLTPEQLDEQLSPAPPCCANRAATASTSIAPQPNTSAPSSSTRATTITCAQPNQTTARSGLFPTCALSSATAAKTIMWFTAVPTKHPRPRAQLFSIAFK